MRRLLRPLAGMRRRSKLLELVLAVIAAVSVGVGAAESTTEVPDLVVLILVVLQVLTLLHLRRRRPLVPYLVSVLVAVLAVDAVGALLVTSYALTRFDDRSRVRTVCALLGVFAVTRPWDVPDLEQLAGVLVGALVVVVLPGALGAVVCARAQLMAALRERAERAEAERELMARVAVRGERTRIAREMHDVVGHRVSLMVLQAGAMEVAAADPARVEQLSLEVQRAGRQALQELRQMVGVLRSADGDGDLGGGLGGDAPLAPQPDLTDVRQLVEDSRAAGVPVELTELPPGAAPVDPVVGRAAYRIVQEALTNAGRHAPGAPTRVHLERQADRVVVRVVNGPPVEPPQALPGGGFGLVGLGERVRTLDGSLRAEPRLDGGFLLEAVLPT